MVAILKLQIPFLENEGGNGQKKFPVKNGRELLFKSGPDAKNEICWNKIGSLGAEIWTCKVRTNVVPHTSYLGSSYSYLRNSEVML